MLRSFAAPELLAAAGARERAAVRPAATAAPATAHAPAISVPLSFMLAGVVALSGAVGLLAWRPAILASYHYNQWVVAVTHLTLLGWLGSVVFGALYQLVPVALETRLFSERLARWHFVFHVVGVAGMVWSFWRWDLKQVGHWGSVFAVGVGLFGYNLARTLARLPRWNLIASGLASGLVWLGLAVLAGLTLATGKCSYDATATLAPTSVLGAMLHTLRAVAGFTKQFDQFGAMHAHAHLGGLGGFLILLVTLSYKLLPMFTLGALQSPRRAAGSLVLLNVATLGLGATLLLRNPWKLAFALVAVAGLALYGWEFAAILRARQRRPLDWGLECFIAGLGSLIPLAVLAVGLCWPSLPLNQTTGQLENLYGFLAIFGVFSLAILGMLHKIVPFLVWFGRYRPWIGRCQVPTFAEMYSPVLQAAGFGSHLAGLLVTAVGIVLASEPAVRLGAVLLAGSVLCLWANLVRILAHLAPRLRPLAGSALLPKPAS